MSTVPLELIVDILLRLPVKSLCRFRCVSKSWLALIKHPRFVKLHFDRTQKQMLLLDTKYLFSVDLETVSSSEDKIFAAEIDFPGKKLYPEINCLSCIGSCNGLVCILTDPRYLFLYNPSTKECKQIPDFHFEDAFIYGFGCIESVDDYKFVKITDMGNYVEVYSLRKDSWTRTENNFQLYDRHFQRGIPGEGVLQRVFGDLYDRRHQRGIPLEGVLHRVFGLNDRRYQRGIPLEGVLHWVFGDFGVQNAIVTFDLVEERLNTLSLPDTIVIENELGCSIGLLSGFLCLTTEKRDCINEFWIMQAYGNKDSWTRILIVNWLSCLRPLCRLLRPLCYLENGKTMLLYKTNGQLVSKPKDGNFKIIEVDGIPKDWFDVTTYTESLVSPNCENESSIRENRLDYWLA